MFRASTVLIGWLPTQVFPKYYRDPNPGEAVERCVGGSCATPTVDQVRVERRRAHAFCIHRHILLTAPGSRVLFLRQPNIHVSLTYEKERVPPYRDNDVTAAVMQLLVLCLTSDITLHIPQGSSVSCYPQCLWFLPGTASSQGQRMIPAPHFE